MTLYAFNALSTNDQYRLVWEHGIFLLSRPVERSSLMLYAIGNFFVEIRYEPGSNQLSGCRSFRSTIALEPYLGTIVLSSFATENDA